MLRRRGVDRIMEAYIRISKSYICLETDEIDFYIGAKYFDALISAIQTAKTMPEGSIITLKVDVEEERKEELWERMEEEEEEEEELF